MMNNWIADYAVAVEISRQAISIVLNKFLEHLRSQGRHKTAGRFGRVGSYEAELTDLSVTDIEDVPPVGGGVETDLLASGKFKFRLLWVLRANAKLEFSIKNVAIDLSRTPAGLPKGVVASITPALSVKIVFKNARFITGWLLNKVLGPMIATGVWLAFRIIRKVEIPLWDIVDVFAALGLRFAPGSPLLTAQKVSAPSSLLLASDFNLTNPLLGDPNQLKKFIPANTNIGAGVHERTVAAAVEYAFVKGWAPSRFRINKWKIYINAIGVRFEKDKVIASGSLKAKRGKCWCRVKARIQFKVAVEPKIATAPPPNDPQITFKYDADINTQISTSGMLTVLGVIMFAPLFMALTTSLALLINLALDKLLPFKMAWSRNGLVLTIAAKSLHFSGFVPLSMTFPLQLAGQGAFSLKKFQEFQLPGLAKIKVKYTRDSLSVQEDELRAAAEIK